MLSEAYWEDYVFCLDVFKWHKRFSEVRPNVEGDEHSGWPSTSKTEKIIHIVLEDRRLNVWMIAEAVNIEKDTAWKILYEDLNMKKKDGKECHKEISTDILQELDAIL